MNLYFAFGVVVRVNEVGGEETEKVNYEEVFKLLFQDRLQRDLMYRTLFLAEESGAAVKAVIYMLKYPEDAEAHKAELFTQLADLVAMIRALCNVLHFDFEKVDNQGLLNLMTFVSRRLVKDT